MVCEIRRAWLLALFSVCKDMLFPGSGLLTLELSLEAFALFERLFPEPRRVSAKLDEAIRFFALAMAVVHSALIAGKDAHIMPPFTSMLVKRMMRPPLSAWSSDRVQMTTLTSRNMEETRATSPTLKIAMSVIRLAFVICRL